jgi:hypothetical protein
MERILVFSDHIDSSMLASCETERSLIFPYDQHELCGTIVHEESILGVVMDFNAGDEENKELIVSLHRHFPLLKIGLISPVEVSGKNVQWIDSGSSEEEFVRAVCRFIRGPYEMNRRDFHRFDWILHGYLDGEVKEEQKFKVRSLSAGGAYLESSLNPPEPGQMRNLRITFQNFQLFAECEILDRRSTSSNLPPGFGVRFLSLHQKTKDLINRIINDAVFQVLMEPDMEPDLPSLYEEEFTPDLIAL